MIGKNADTILRLADGQSETGGSEMNETKMNETKNKYTVQQKFEVWYEVEVEASDDTEAMTWGYNVISEGGGVRIDESLIPCETFWVRVEGDDEGKTYCDGFLVENEW